jgi:hypothetical protein
MKDDLKAGRSFSFGAATDGNGANFSLVDRQNLV